MAKKDRIKSKSIYTIRRKHQSVVSGTVYEHDHITILPTDGIYDDEIAFYPESNFKYKVGDNTNEKKRHTRGGWEKPGDGETTWWTKNDIDSSSTISDESQIVLKPNYSSLKDFAYYGSAEELIRATVNDIIARFPGGIKYYGSSTAPTIQYGGETYYLVSNEFEIDCWSAGNVFSGDVTNPMRILSSSYMNYNIGDTEQTLSQPNIRIIGDCPNSIIGTVTIGETTLNIYKDGEGKNHLITEQQNAKGWIIKPKKEFISKFWETLDEFERVLLNRDTTPVYKATFDTPYQNENGYFYSKKSYVWPTIDGDDFTPDITTTAFQGYLEALISLANFHDEYDSDNIWRMMTHEAIKNLDWTFINEQDGETEDMSDIDSSRMKAMLHVYGRAFDDVKRYADNIKSTNNISYDEKNNIPDYFLSDNIENDGWIAKNVSPSDDKSVVSDEISKEFSGKTAIFAKSGKTGSEINAKFARRLALSSNYIQSMKGTRRGIEAILHMFGYKETDNKGTKVPGEFDVTEYIGVVKDFPSYSKASFLRGLGGEYLNADEQTNFMEGYPVAIIAPNGAEDESDYYLVPNYSSKAKYKYPIYFQSKGGWGKMADKYINLSMTSFNLIKSTDAVRIYEETEPYMRYAANIDEMLAIPNNEVRENMVCYVVDISGLDNNYEMSSEDKVEFGNATHSHYFVLKNKALSSYVGHVKNVMYDCYGWRNVFVEEYDGSNELTNDGTRVLYLESLNADFKGNNPHVGKGLYDDGNEYLEKFRFLFGDAINEGGWNYLKEDTTEYSYYDKGKLQKKTGKEIWNELLQFGFGYIGVQKEDDKCHFFYDTLNGEKPDSSSNGLSFIPATNKIESSTKDENSINAYQNGFYKSLTIPDAEKNVIEQYDEAAGFSVFNVKTLRINFGIGGNEYLQKYIKNVVMKYLQEMIPSTTILIYTFDDASEAFDGIGYDKYNRIMKIVADTAFYLDDDATYYEEAIKMGNDYKRASDIEKIQ